MTVEKVIDELSDTYCTIINSGVLLRTLPSVMLWGAPGVGKSQAIRQIAKDIKKNTKFARICFIEFCEAEDTQKTYSLIRKIEYTKYHFFPDGYMIRTSAKAHKESVRVSKTAVKNGVDFHKIGNLLISKFKENPAVKGVKVVFVTEAAVDFSKLENLSRKNHEITETLNQVMNNLAFDCDTCNLKAICDEVDGMRELHFKNSMGK